MSTEPVTAPRRRVSHLIGGLPTVPAIVIDAGQHAVDQYRAYFDRVLTKPALRVNYRCIIGRFFLWAEDRRLSLSSITAADAMDFVRDVFPTPTRHRTRTKYLSAIRGLFRHLAAAGVVPANPIDIHRPRETPAVASRPPGSLLALAELKEAVLALDHTYTEDSEFFHAGLVVLAPLSVGTIAPEEISCFTGVPVPLVQAFAERLLRNGCWAEDGSVDFGSEDPDFWDQGAIVNILVATGYIETLPWAAGAPAGEAWKFVATAHAAALLARQESPDEPSPPGWAILND